MVTHNSSYIRPSTNDAHQSACKLCNIVTYSIHLKHLSHRPLLPVKRQVPPSCLMPGTWSVHKAPHKITFSDRIQFIADYAHFTVHTIWAGHANSCLLASTLHTKFLSYMPQISLADGQYNYCLLATCLKDFFHPDQPAVSATYSMYDKWGKIIILYFSTYSNLGEHHSLEGRHICIHPKLLVTFDLS